MNWFRTIVGVFLFGPCVLHAQNSKIYGKVVNSKNEPLHGATIVLDGKKRSTATDYNGAYTFSGLYAGVFVIKCSYTSYADKVIGGITVKPGEAVNVDFVMDEIKGKLKEVVVTSSARNAKPKESIASLIIAQKNSASVSDGISAESIKRTPDRNTSDVLKRISGASIQEDKFVIIRGLNDRYNAAFLNGATLPSSESDRKAFAFDIFPANMLDNLIIYKTATPDKPGEFAGGLIEVNTKGIPSQNFETFSIGTGFNTFATLQNRKYYEGGKWDFIGADDGTRALPNNFPDKISSGATAAERASYAKKIPNRWKLYQANAMPNLNLQYSLGHVYQKKGKDFIGLLLSATYTKTYNRTKGQRFDFDPAKDDGDDTLNLYTKDDVYTKQTLLGLLANVSVKANTNNSYSLKTIYSINSDDRIIDRYGQDDNTDDPNRFVQNYTYWFTSNKLFSTQLSGEHFFPTSKIRGSWVASFSNVQRDIPSLRKIVYDSSGNGGYDQFKAVIVGSQVTFNDGGLLFFAKNRENIWNAKGDFTKPFKLGSNQNQVKWGAFLQYRARKYNARLMGFAKNTGPAFDENLRNLPAEKLFDPSNIGILKNGKSGLNINEAADQSYPYTAQATLAAAYAMLDQRWGKYIRLIYGVRAENYVQKVDAKKPEGEPANVNNSKADVLPSANLVVSLSPKQNLRLSYATTLNRPEFRELASSGFYDFATKIKTTGNDTLKRASIQNFDIRYEIFPGKAQLFSVSGFYKTFQNPIELVAVENTRNEAYYKNGLSAYCYGAELEVRTLLGGLFNTSNQSILNDITFFSNVALIKSEVRVNDGSIARIKSKRTMQGQSPYLFNAGFTYQNDDKGWSASLVGNRFGQRIFIAGSEIEGDRWEYGRTVIDFQIAKNITKKNIELKLNVKDVLAQKLYFFWDINNNQKFDKNSDDINSITNFGRTISFSFTYKY